MSIPELSSVSNMPGPFEILDLGDGGIKDLIVTTYVIGKMKIKPRTGAPPKEIVALRVFVPEKVKTLYPDYYDITGQTLIAQLLPILEAGGYQKKIFTIKKVGSGPEARFSVKVT